LTAVYLVQMENGWKIGDGKRIHHHWVLLGSRGGVRQVALPRSRLIQRFPQADQLVPKTITEQALQITVDSEKFLEHFFERADVASGAAVSEGGATFTLLDGTKTKGFGIETIVKVSVALGEKIVTAAVARWLLEKLSPSAGHIKYRDVIYQFIKSISKI
jgi:hypothetical protein